ncbi:MAG: hypothetical protein AAGG07_07105 [Planctomycetota bacterium]
MKQCVGPIALGSLLLSSTAGASAQTSATITLGNERTVPALRAVVPARRIETPTIRRPMVIRRSGTTLICPPGDLPCIGPFPLERVGSPHRSNHGPHYTGRRYSASSYSSYYVGRSSFVLPHTLTTFPTSSVSITVGSPASASSSNISAGGVLFSTRRYSTRQYGVMGPHQRPVRRTPRNLLR